MLRSCEITLNPSEYPQNELLSLTRTAMLIKVMNMESLRLYRDILRASRVFTWPNEKGELWRDVLRSAARKEFEAASVERDPLIVAQLLLVGRDCLNQTQDKFNAAHAKMMQNIDNSRTDQR